MRRAALLLAASLSVAAAVDRAKMQAMRAQWRKRDDDLRRSLAGVSVRRRTWHQAAQQQPPPCAADFLVYRLSPSLVEPWIW